MPIFLVLLISALLALILDPEYAAHLAYFSGVLIGADRLRLNTIAALGMPVAAIGGCRYF